MSTPTNLPAETAPGGLAGIHWFEMGFVLKSPPFGPVDVSSRLSCHTACNAPSLAAAALQ